MVDTYQLNAILQPGFLFPVLVVSFVLLLDIAQFYRLFSRGSRGLPLRSTAFGAVLALSLSAALFLPMFQTLVHTVFLPGESDTEPISAQGIVEERAPLLYLARYYTAGSDEIQRASRLRVDGTNYLCLGAEQLGPGDRILFSFYPKSRVILSFQREGGEITSGQSRGDPGYARLGAAEILLFATAILFSVVCGLLLALASARKELPKNACWILGDLLYRNGIDLFFITMFFALLAAPLIPSLRSVPFGMLCAPAILVSVLREVRVYYAMDEQCLSVYLFGALRVRTVDIQAVRKACLFHSENGGLLALDCTEGDMLACKTFWAFLQYRLRAGKDLLLLPIKEHMYDYARAEFVDRFDMMEKKTRLTSDFPLWQRRT